MAANVSPLAANYPENVVERLPGSLANGVYYGWACVDGGEVYQMVMSIGWNPHFENEKRSMVAIDAELYYLWVATVIFLFSRTVCT